MKSCVNYFESWLLFWDTIVSVFLPWIAVVMMLSYIIYWVYKTTTKDHSMIKGWLILGFVSLGAMFGITAGASKTPVLGTFLPAFLTFISGVLGYLFSKESMNKWRDVIPFCMAGMLCASVINAFVGSAIKSEYEKFERKYEVWLIEKKNSLDVQKEILLLAAKSGKNVVFPEVENESNCK